MNIFVRHTFPMLKRKVLWGVQICEWGVQIRCDTGTFETPKDIDDFTNCPTHRPNLGVGWNRGSNSRCRVPKEMSGHGKGRVKSIPKADRGIGKRVSQILLKMSGKFVQSGFGK